LPRNGELTTISSWHKGNRCVHSRLRCNHRALRYDEILVQNSLCESGAPHEIKISCDSSESCATVRYNYGIELKKFIVQFATRAGVYLRTYDVNFDRAKS